MGFISFLFVAGIIGLIVYYVKKRQKEQEEAQKLENEKKQMKLESLQEKWDKKKEEYLTYGLPVVNEDNLRLTKNEVCHFLGVASFCKIKQQTTGYAGGSRGVSVRVMKGVSFRVGNYRGQPIREEVIEKTTGTIYLTSKKIVFTASKNSCVVKYDDIINLNVNKSMLQLQTNKKTYLFDVEEDFDFMLTLECIMNKEDDNMV